MPVDPTAYVHPRALVETDRVGARSRIWAFAHVMEGAEIGADVNLGDHTFVESGVRIGDGVTVKNGVSLWSGVVLEDGVFVGPNAVFTNDLVPRARHRKPATELLPTRVRAGATVGANATIRCGIELGAGCFVGAGTVVLEPVPPRCVVVGNPARVLGHRCDCGEPLAAPWRCPCGLSYDPRDDGGLDRIPADEGVSA